MLFQITEQLKNDLAELEKNQAAQNNGNGNKLMASRPPVLQLNLIPASIDKISHYTDPYSPENPNGDLLSLFRFRELTNKIPRFDTFYEPSGITVETVYNSVVSYAKVSQDALYTKQLFYNAQTSIAKNAMPALGDLQSWEPVYASPANWYDQIAEKTDLFETIIDFAQPTQAALASNYTIIGDNRNQTLTWSQLQPDGKLAQTPLQTNSVLQKLKFKFLQVQLNRPWLDFSLFSTGGWSLSGQDAGFISSGSLTINEGIFPLYPTSFILATDLEVVGKLDDLDQQKVNDSINTTGRINLGPFSVSKLDSTSSQDVLTHNGFFIVAWISQLVPLSPK